MAHKGYLEKIMANKKFTVLFLCTGNSARSIMAEALLSRWSHGNFTAYSAGSKPKGQVHPMTLEILKKNNFNIDGFRSKSWEEYTGPDSPEIDFIITVCSNAANEACPVIPGKPVTAHWDIDDPAREFESGEAQENAFLKAYRELERRIQKFTQLPLDKLDKITLQEHLKKLSA